MESAQPEVLHDARALKTVGIGSQDAIGVILLKCLIVGSDKAAFIEQKQRKTKDSDFISNQVRRARRVRKRLFEFLLGERPFG